MRTPGQPSPSFERPNNLESPREQPETSQTPSLAPHAPALAPTELSISRPAAENGGSTPQPPARAASISGIVAKMGVGVHLSTEVPDPVSTPEIAGTPSPTEASEPPAPPEANQGGGNNEPPIPPTGPGESAPNPGDLPPTAKTRAAFEQAVGETVAALPTWGHHQELFVAQPPSEGAGDTKQIFVRCKSVTYSGLGQGTHTTETISVGERYPKDLSTEDWPRRGMETGSTSYLWQERRSDESGFQRPVPVSEAVTARRTDDTAAARELLTKLIDRPDAPEQPELTAWATAVRDSTVAYTGEDPQITATELIASQPPASVQTRLTFAPEVHFSNGTTVKYDMAQSTIRDASGGIQAEQTTRLLQATTSNGSTYRYEQEERAGQAPSEHLYDQQEPQATDDAGRITDAGLQNLQRILAEAVASRAITSES